MTTSLHTYTVNDIVPQLPEGYRWANERETERWPYLKDRMVQVRVGGTYDDPQTDLGIREV